MSLLPHLLESVYRKVLAYELRKRGQHVVEEQPIPVVWEDVRLELGFRADLIVDSLVVVEIKSVETVAPAGHFRPREVREKRVAKNVRLSFRIDQTEFARELPDDPAAVLTHTVELANQPLSQSGRAERFFLLDGPDCVLIVFVPPSVLERAREAKLIPGRKSVVEFAIGSAAHAQELVVPAKKTGKSRVKRCLYELSLAAVRELFTVLGADGTEPLREILCASNGAVVLQLDPAAVTRLLAMKKSELNRHVQNWVKEPAMRDSPLAREVAYCTDRLADVLGFLKTVAKPQDSLLISVRPK